jgi:hypothetical protein
MAQLTRAQYDWLVRPITPGRVRQLRGNYHVEQWDVRRHLIRAFGFGGFDITTTSLELVREIEHLPYTAAGEVDPRGKSRWTVVYRAEIRLVIKDANGSMIAHYEDAATGDSQNQPSLGDAHDQACKTALSQALKRCAVNLGDQFGLSLYNGGSPQAVVLQSLIVPGVLPEAVGGEALAEVAARDTAVAPDPSGVFDELAKTIAACESESGLATAWGSVKAEFKAERLTTQQANILKAALAERRTEVIAEQAAVNGGVQ